MKTFTSGITEKLVLVFPGTALPPGFAPTSNAPPERIFLSKNFPADLEVLHFFLRNYLIFFSLYGIINDSH